jgi:TonB-dependent receptor
MSNSCPCGLAHFFLFFVFFFFMAISQSFSQGVGGIRGQVVDSDFGQPISRASVTLLDTPFGAMTDDQGNFTISGVPPGLYSLSVRSSGYLPKLVPETMVAEGQFNDLRIETIAEVEELEELVVPGELEKTSEVGLLGERQSASAVLDTIGADLISKLGASTAGDALKRMVGTSVVDGKYVVVRGLSDRYVNTLLNGGRLPSSDPDKRAINVDLFPGPTLESINTTKTFTPDQPGDFTGGSVDIRTKKFPEKPSLGVSATVEYNSQATFNPDFLTYAGGGTGPFGFRANQRAIPQSVINNPSLIGLNPANLNAGAGNLAEAEAVNQAMRQMSPVVGLTNSTPGPNYSFNLQGGDTVEYGPDQQIGSFGAFSYRHKNIYNPQTVRGNYSINAGNLNRDIILSDNKASEDVLWGGLANLAVQPEKNQTVGINVIFNQQATDTCDFQISDQALNPSLPANQQLQYTTIQYGERQLGYIQLNGDHIIPTFRDIQIDWVGGVGRAKLNEPDQRLFQNSYNTTTGQYSELQPADPSFTQSKRPLQRYQRELSEGEYNAIANLSIPYFEDKENPSKFKTGFYLDTTQRQYNQASFVYEYGGANFPADYSSYTAGTDDPPWSTVYLNEDRSGLVNPAGLGNGQFMSWTAVNNSSGFGDFYNAYQQVIASYAMTEFRLFPQLTFTGGARFENTDIQIQGPTSTLFPTAADANAVIQQLDLLPAVGATFQLLPEVNFRLAWSQTLARPSFKEMGPVVTQDFSDATIFVGNPKLKLSNINNYDVRIEYFPRPGEVLAVSGFYKSIKKPIEQAIFQLGDTQFYQYQNNPNGTLWGAEFEARKRLDQVQAWLKNFSVNFNATYVQSQVPLSEDQQFIARTRVNNYATTRPLQGQPLYIINAGLSYDDQERGFFAGLFYNVTGPYLYAVGYDLPDIYEQPAPSLDFNLTQEFADNWSLTFRGKNLLNPVFRQTITYQGQEVNYLAYTKGFDLSLSVKYGF